MDLIEIASNGALTESISPFKAWAIWGCRGRSSVFKPGENRWSPVHKLSVELSGGISEKIQMLLQCTNNAPWKFYWCSGERSLNHLCNIHIVPIYQINPQSMWQNNVCWAARPPTERFAAHWHWQLEILTRTHWQVKSRKLWENCHLGEINPMQCNASTWSNVTVMHPWSKPIPELGPLGYDHWPVGWITRGGLMQGLEPGSNA